MKKRIYIGIGLSLAITLLFFLVSCTNGIIIIVRVPFEDLTKGAFYNGSLAFNSSDDLFSQLDKGTIIGFQDITYGWEQDDEDTEHFLPIILTRNYGYIYIRDISDETLVYDYLIYGPDGVIIERKDNVTLNTILGEAVFASKRGNGFHGIVYHRNVITNHPSIGDSCLISFKHETPDQLIGAVPEEYEYSDTFKRVVFRLQQTGDNFAPQFSNGLVALSNTQPKSLVVNSSFLSRYKPDEGATPTEISFYKTENLPDFYQGDFILDEYYGMVRKVNTVDTSNDGYVIIQTATSTMEDALGTVVIDVDGDLEQIIERYGSQADKDAMARVKKNLIEKEWDIELYNEHNISAEIQNKFDLDVDCSIKFHLSWKSFSSNGKLSFPMKFSSILVIEALAGFQKDHEYKLADPGISFSVCGVPVRVSVPVYFFYDITAEIAKLDFEFGPELDMELGFTYDIGAKIKFKWHVIPDGIKKWSHAHGIYNHSTKIHGPDFTAEFNPSFVLDVGFKTYPGITIACVIRPQLEIPVALSFTLDRKELILDFVTSGDMEIKLDLKFYSHTFHFGRVFHYSKELYRHIFD